VVKIGKPQRVAKKEHRRVIADDVPVALLSIELQRVAADVALGVRGAAFVCDGGEAGKHRGLFADLRKDLGLGVAGNVVRDGEGAVCAGALGVHAALRDHFAVEMGQLFEQPHVLQQGGPARPGGLDVEIVRDRRTRCMGQGWAFGFIAHCVAP